MPTVATREPTNTMLPPVDNSGSALWVTTYAAPRLVSMIRCHSSRRSSGNGTRLLTPALCTRMSSSPSVARHSSTRWSTSSACVTSAMSTRCCPPTSFSSRDSDVSASLECRPQVTTLAPARAYSSTISRPMPRDPPVTSAFLPSSSPFMFPPQFEFLLTCPPRLTASPLSRRRRQQRLVQPLPHAGLVPLSFSHRQQVAPEAPNAVGVGHARLSGTHHSLLPVLRIFTTGVTDRLRARAWFSGGRSLPCP